MKYEITKYQIEKLADEDSIVKDCLKEWFPDVFNTKLDTGKWYKGSADIKFLICYQSNGNDNYGFWRDQPYKDNLIFGDCWYNMSRLATEEEISAALIAEAKKRGYKGGIKLSPLESCSNAIDTEKEDVYSYIPKVSHYIGNRLQLNGTGIYQDGKWAEILPQEKTVVPMDKALKIIAKKMKVSPENIEIKN